MTTPLEKFAQINPHTDGEQVARDLLRAVQEERAKNLEKYAELEGEVMVHAMASTVLMYKEAATRGLCWDCDQRIPSPRSVYRRCDICEANDE